LLIGGMAAAEVPDLLLNVMTFNVRSGMSGDGDNAWPRRKDTLVNAVREYDPDLLGAQECFDFQAGYLCERLPQYAWFGVSRDGQKHDERMAVIYKKDLFNAIETGNFWLNPTPDVPGSIGWGANHERMVTWGRFYHLESKREFHFFNTHFEHECEEARRNSAALLLDRLKAVPESGAVVVTGDFNAVAEGSVPWQALTAGGLRDAWLAAAERVGPAVTRSDFKPLQSENPPDHRIDWILVRGPVQVDRCETVTYNEEGRMPSDHFPVLARLRLTARGDCGLRADHEDTISD